MTSVPINPSLTHDIVESTTADNAAVLTGTSAPESLPPDQSVPPFHPKGPPSRPVGGLNQSRPAAPTGSSANRPPPGGPLKGSSK
ncbi:hypothetical protein BC834DRAFT_459592 [Gloeopeniophorella convolvens]|nr:hypothetical protein BC834DRAFT_459592 [Gloeopeniophorella convolvens]